MRKTVRRGDEAFTDKYIECMTKNNEGEVAWARRAAMPALVLALGFLFNVIARGVGDSYMVFLLPLGEEFGWQRSAMTSVYSALMVVSGLAAPLAGMVFERWGPRVLYGTGLALLACGYSLAGHLQHLWQFYLCVGLLGGLGSAAIGMVPASALISRWFTRRMSTAIGLAYAGFGCGSLFIVPLVQTVIDRQGWRQAYGAIGLALAVALPLAVCLPWRRMAAGASGRAGLRPPPRPPGDRSPLHRALRDRRFWLLVQIMFFTAVGMYLVIVQSVAYLVDVGMTPLKAAGAFGTAGMLSVVGVSSAGWLADRWGHRRAALLSFVGTLVGVACLYAMTWTGPQMALLAGYVLVFGICQGARGPLIASLSARLFPGPGQATIYGAIYACMAVGSGLGALLSGVLHDLTGGYRATFVLSAISMLLASLPFLWASSIVPAARPAP